LPMIRSLPSDYSSFVSAITLMDSIDMSKLKTAFITEESNRKEAMEGQFGATAAANLATMSRTSNVIICGWCERPGHVEDQCFSKKASMQQDRASAKARRTRGRRPGGSNNSNTS
ncbi:hypothetical protein M422DRAFT_130689, partial [Sphaerobolus stellatus SS14]